MGFCFRHGNHPGDSCTACAVESAKEQVAAELSEQTREIEALRRLRVNEERAREEAQDRADWHEFRQGELENERHEEHLLDVAAEAERLRTARTAAMTPEERSVYERRCKEEKQAAKAAQRERDRATAERAAALRDALARRPWAKKLWQDHLSPDRARTCCFVAALLFFGAAARVVDRGFDGYFVTALLVGIAYTCVRAAEESDEDGLNALMMVVFAAAFVGLAWPAGLFVLLWTLVQLGRDHLSAKGAAVYLLVALTLAVGFCFAVLRS